MCSILHGPNFDEEIESPRARTYILRVTDCFFLITDRVLFPRVIEIGGTVIARMKCYQFAKGPEKSGPPALFPSAYAILRRLKQLE